MSESSITNPRMMLIREGKKLRQKIEDSGEFHILPGERFDMEDVARMTCMAIATIHHHPKLKKDTKKEIVILAILSICPSDDVEEVLPGFVDVLTAYYVSLTMAEDERKETRRKRCCGWGLCTIL